MVAVESGLFFEINDHAYTALKRLEQELGTGDRHATVAAWNSIPSGLRDELRQLCTTRILADPSGLSADFRKAYMKMMLGHRIRSIHLMVTQTCNLACRYCYGVDNRFSDSGLKMSEKTAEESVDFLIDASGRRKRLRVFFFGGEPLLNFEVITHVVDYARRKTQPLGKEIFFSISTNGSLLTEKREAYLLDNDFAMLISVDGPKRHHDRMRPLKSGGGSFDLVARNARRIVRRARWEGQVKLRCTLNHEFHSGREARRSLSELGTDEIGVGSAIEPASHGTEYDLTRDDLTELIREGDEEFLEVAETLLGGRMPRYSQFLRAFTVVHKPSRSKIGCGVCRNDLTADVDGNLYPCHRYVGMDQYVIGNITDGVDQNRVRSYYEDLLEIHDSVCSRCWARYMCGGHCPWLRARTDGSHRRPRGWECSTTKGYLEKYIGLYTLLSRERPEFLAKLVGDPLVEQSRSWLQKEKAASSHTETEDD
ncbi:MAG: SPASM domain-containing protein [Candidatus Eisenbacteria bacterium]|nr:SPASM domain-containing protein [Candidatus Latescibacterota bacterium]MBD3334497.1 SPASM domain-containing protein [Candidatus Eisenbacteria bacterium]